VDAGSDDGISFESVTRAGLALGLRTKRTSWSLSQGVNASFFTDDGGNNDNNRSSDFDGIRPDFNGSMTYRGQRYTITNRLRFSQRSTAISRFEDFLDEEGEVIPPTETDFANDRISVDEDTDQFDLRFSTGVSYQLTQLDSLNFGVNTSVRRFDESIAGLEDSNNIGGNIGWSHRLDPISSAGVSLSVLRFNSQDTVSRDASKGINLSLSGNYSTQLRPDLSFGASLGARYTSEETDTEVEDIFGNTVVLSDEDTSVGATGSLSIGFSGRRSSFNLGVSQDVRPSSFGGVRNALSVNSGYSYSLTPRASASISGDYTLETDLDFGGDAEHFLSVGPSVSYRLSPNWNASLAYAFRAVDDIGGFETSNQLSFTLRRGFTIIP